MEHLIFRVISVEPLGGYRLRVGFDDRSSREIDLGPVLEGEIYGPLRDPAMFVAVGIDPEVHTLVWPNGADFDPALLHDWPSHEPAMRELAKRWSKPQEGSEFEIAPDRSQASPLDVQGVDLGLSAEEIGSVIREMHARESS